MNLYQKVVLITGASSGIGKAVALVLSTRQNRIVITARREELLEDVAKEIRANILKALELEIQEYLFPISLKIGIMLERLLPQFIVNKVLSRVIPSEY